MTDLTEKWTKLDEGRYRTALWLTDSLAGLGNTHRELGRTHRGRRDVKYWQFDLSIVFAALNWSYAAHDFGRWRSVGWVLFATFWTLAAWSLRPWAPTTGEKDG